MCVGMADGVVTIRLAVYEDVEGAETALRILHNTELDGRRIFLRKVGWLGGLVGWLL